MGRLDDPGRPAEASTQVAFEVKIARDHEQGVWYVSESAIPGLNAEASTLDELVAVITDLAPDLIVATCQERGIASGPGIPLRIEHLVHARPAPAF